MPRRAGQIHAKVVDGEIVAYDYKDNPQSKPAADGGPTWRPVISAGPMPAYDPLTQHPPETTRQIERNAVRDVWQAPVDKTPGEINAEKDAAASAVDDAGRDILRSMLQGMFLMLNDIRDLKGQQPINKAQFRDWIKARMD